MTAPSYQDRAGFWRRAVALSVDAIAALLLTGVAYYAVLAGYESDFGFMPSSAWRWLLLAQLVPWLLYSFSEVLFCATPGKMLLGV